MRQQPRPARRAGVLAAGAAGADPGRHVSREDAYQAVQRNAMAGVGTRRQFPGACCKPIRTSPPVCPTDQIAALFDLGYHTKNVDTIFKRVFGRS